jgi:putative copper export protein
MVSGFIWPWHHGLNSQFTYMFRIGLTASGWCNFPYADINRCICHDGFGRVMVIIFVLNASVSLRLVFPIGVLMLSTSPLLCAVSLVALTYGHPGTLDDRGALGATSHFNETCHRIAAAISNGSEVFFPCASSCFCSLLTFELIPGFLESLSSIYL